MPKLPAFLGIRRGLSSTGQKEKKDEKIEDDKENFNDHVEIDFSASKSEPPAVVIEQIEIVSKQSAATKPQSKVSPFSNMHHKLNFIPHNQRDKLNAQFLATLPGVLKLAEIVSV
jgi:hypothetical protein